MKIQMVNAAPTILDKPPLYAPSSLTMRPISDTMPESRKNTIVNILLIIQIPTTPSQMSMESIHLKSLSSNENNKKDDAKDHENTEACAAAFGIGAPLNLRA